MNVENYHMNGSEHSILLRRQFSELIYKFNAISVKIPANVFHRNWHADPKTLYRDEGLRIARQFCKRTTKRT